MRRNDPPHIVVIEDHPEYLDYVATLLRRAGYAVATFTKGTEALRYLEHNPAGVVVTDVFMPEMDGFEVLKEVRRRFPELPIIGVSGGGPLMPMCLDAMQSLGANATFAKPVDADALLIAIARLSATPTDRPHDESIVSAVESRALPRSRQHRK